MIVRLGTRSDIESFLAQTEIFAGAGHKVICLCAEQFRATVSQLGYEFIEFDKGF